MGDSVRSVGVRDHSGSALDCLSTGARFGGSRAGMADERTGLLPMLRTARDEVERPG